MKKAIIILWIFTLLTIIFVAFTQRYQISIMGKAPFGYKIDKMTGEVWLIANRDWSLHQYKIMKLRPIKKVKKAPKKEKSKNPLLKYLPKAKKKKGNNNAKRKQ